MNNFTPLFYDVSYYYAPQSQRSDFQQYLEQLNHNYNWNYFIARGIYWEISNTRGNMKLVNDFIRIEGSWDAGGIVTHIT